MAQLLSTPLFSDSNLQAYYKCEDTSDSKNSHTLTNNNTVTFSSAKYGLGANFGSGNTNKFLSITSSLSYNGGAYSISLWFKQSAEITSGSYTLADTDDSASMSLFYMQYDYNGGTPRLYFNRGTSGVADQPATYSVSLGTGWNHLVMTYDGSTITAYLNGVSVATASASGNGINAVTAQTTLGCNARNANNFTSGIVDDVGFFNKKLSATEVRQLFANPNGFLAFM